MSEQCMCAIEASKADMTPETVDARLFLEIKDEAMRNGFNETEAEEYARISMLDLEKDSK
jgi:hypothetical protein